MYLKRIKTGTKTMSYFTSLLNGLSGLHELAKRDSGSTVNNMRKRAQGGDAYTPELRARQTESAGGIVTADARDRDHWGTGDMETLTLEQMRALAQARVSGRFF